MKLLNRIFIVIIFLGCLQILTESFFQDQTIASTELNLEIEKEEKEDKTEFIEDIQLLDHSFVSSTTYNNLIVGPYQNPTLSVRTSPPEVSV